MAVSLTPRRVVGLVLVLVGFTVTVLALVSVVGNEGGNDPVIVEVTADHGLHRRDLPVLGVAAIGAAVSVCGLGLVRSIHE